MFSTNVMPVIDRTRQINSKKVVPKSAQTNPNTNRKFGTVLNRNSTPTLSSSDQKSNQNSAKNVKDNVCHKNIGQLVGKENSDAIQCTKQTNKSENIKSKHIGWFSENLEINQIDDYYRTLINERMLAIMETMHENKIISDDIRNLRQEIDMLETIMDYAQLGN